MIRLYQLDDSLWFPPIDSALQEPNGLLAVGGDLSVNRLMAAYRQGIFPWYSEDDPILWWSPDPRGVIFTQQYRSSKSLAKHLRRTQPRVTLNHRFEQVIQTCASIPRDDNGTWISDDMCQAYINLHRAGHAHSIEVWQQDALIGGLYGVYANNVFCGESMFSAQTNGSKVAMHYLVEFLLDKQIQLIDCQMQNPHLQSLGCETITRQQFSALLDSQRRRSIKDCDWSPKTLS